MLVGQQGPQIRHKKSEADHGRQDTQATAKGEEAEARFPAADQERLVAPREKTSRPTAAARHFKRREILLAEGGKLVLNGDGSISQLDASGESVGTWATGEAEWSSHAIRFGLQPQAITVAPHGRRVAEPRPRD
jgi:hypothetical protein